MRIWLRPDKLAQLLSTPAYRYSYREQNAQIRPPPRRRGSPSQMICLYVFGLHGGRKGKESVIARLADCETFRELSCSIGFERCDLRLKELPGGIGRPELLISATSMAPPRADRLLPASWRERAGARLTQSRPAWPSLKELPQCVGYSFRTIRPVS